MKGFFKLLAGFFFAFIIVQFLSRCLVEYSAEKMKKSGSTPSLESALPKLKHDVMEINKSLPMILNSELTLETVQLLGDTMLYSARFTNYRSDELDGNGFYNNAYKEQLVAYCTSPDTKFLVDNDITVRRDYYGIDGGFVTQIIIKPSDCTKLASSKKNSVGDKVSPTATSMRNDQKTLLPATQAPNNLNNQSQNGQVSLTKEIQSLLNHRGYYTGIPDGKYGSKTKSAIKAYQNDHGLAPNGIVSQALLGHIKNSSSSSPH